MPSPAVGDSDVPTYYANIVSLTGNANELIMEFRAYLPWHKDQWERGGKVPPPTPLTPGPPAPPPSPEEIYNLKPAVRVVITVPSAQWIAQWLAMNLPGMLVLRSGQTKGN